MNGSPRWLAVLGLVRTGGPWSSLRTLKPGPADRDPVHVAVGGSHVSESQTVDRRCHRRRRCGGPTLEGIEMIIVGVLLLIVGYSVPAPPPVVIGGWLLLIIGLVLAFMGRGGRQVGPRSHYY